MPEVERELRRQIIELVRPLLAERGLSLVDCLTARGRHGVGITLAVAGPEPLTVNDYAALGRFLDDVLAGELPDLGEYRLEVGSPGLERVLRSELELDWARGHLVLARLRKPDGSPEDLIGRLVEIDEEWIVIDFPESPPGADDAPETAPRRLPRKDVVQLRLYHEWPQKFRSKRKHR